LVHRGKRPVTKKGKKNKRNHDSSAGRESISFPQLPPPKKRKGKTKGENAPLKPNCSNRKEKKKRKKNPQHSFQSVSLLQKRPKPTSKKEKTFILIEGYHSEIRGGLG